MGRRTTRPPPGWTARGTVFPDRAAARAGHAPSSCPAARAVAGRARAARSGPPAGVRRAAAPARGCARHWRGRQDRADRSATGYAASWLPLQRRERNERGVALQRLGTRDMDGFDDAITRRADRGLKFHATENQQNIDFLDLLSLLDPESAPYHRHGAAQPV